MIRGAWFFLLAVLVAVGASNVFLGRQLRPLLEKADMLRARGDAKPAALVDEVLVSKYPYLARSLTAMTAPGRLGSTTRLSRFWENLLRHRMPNLVMLVALAAASMAAFRYHGGALAKLVPFAATVYVSGTIAPFAGPALYPRGAFLLPGTATALAVGLVLWFAVRAAVRGGQERAFGEVSRHIGDQSTTWCPLVRQRHQEAVIAVLDSLRGTTKTAAATSPTEAAQLSSHLDEIRRRLDSTRAEAAREHTRLLEEARRAIAKHEAERDEIQRDLQSIEVERKSKLISRSDYKTQRNELKGRLAKAHHMREEQEQVAHALENPKGRVLTMATQAAVAGQALAADLREFFGRPSGLEPDRADTAVAEKIKSLRRTARERRKTEGDLRKFEAVTKELSPSRRRKYEDLGKQARELAQGEGDLSRDLRGRLTAITKAIDANKATLEAARSAANFHAGLEKGAGDRSLKELASKRMALFRKLTVDVEAIQAGLEEARGQLAEALQSEDE